MTMTTVMVSLLLLLSVLLMQPHLVSSQGDAVATLTNETAPENATDPVLPTPPDATSTEASNTTAPEPTGALENGGAPEDSNSNTTDTAGEGDPTPPAPVDGSANNATEIASNATDPVDVDPANSTDNATVNDTSVVSPVEPVPDNTTEPADANSTLDDNDADAEENSTATVAPTEVCVDDADFVQFDMSCSDFAGQECIEFYRQKPNATNSSVAVSTTEEATKKPPAAHPHSFQNTVDLIHSCPVSCAIPCDEFHAFDTKVAMIMTHLSAYGTPKKKEPWPVDKPSRLRLEQVAYEYVRDQFADHFSAENATDLKLYVGIVTMTDQKIWVPHGHRRLGSGASDKTPEYRYYSPDEQKQHHQQMQHDHDSHRVHSQQSAEIVLELKGFTIGLTPDGFGVGEFLSNRLLADDFAGRLQASGGPTFAKVEIPGTPDEMGHKGGHSHHHGNTHGDTASVSNSNNNGDSTDTFFWAVTGVLTVSCVVGAVLIRRKLMYGGRGRFAVVAAEQPVRTVPEGYSGMIT